MIRERAKKEFINENIPIFQSVKVNLCIKMNSAHDGGNTVPISHVKYGSFTLRVASVLLLTSCLTQDKDQLGHLFADGRQPLVVEESIQHLASMKSEMKEDVKYPATKPRLALISVLYLCKDNPL